MHFWDEIHMKPFNIWFLVSWSLEISNKLLFAPIRETFCNLFSFDCLVLRICFFLSMIFCLKKRFHQVQT